MTATLYTVSLPQGTLSIVPRPTAGEGLEDAIAALHAAGIDALVSLLAPNEAQLLGLGEEGAICAETGIRFFSFPIRDRGIPPFTPPTFAFVDMLAGMVRSGQHVGVHCRLCIGRSALITASILVRLGLAPDIAFGRLAQARGCLVPDTPEQRLWVERLGRL
jgi:protein-tyrosine phosphatase